VEHARTPPAKWGFHIQEKTASG